MENAIISLKGVSKEFQTKERSFLALRKVDLEVKKGEYLTIVGKSGSGKSTLLNMITGIDHPTGGSIEFHGKTLGSKSESELAHWRGRNVGIVFQFFQLIPTLTILENILLAMEFVNVIPKQERLQRAMALLADTEITDQAHKMPAALSGGQQQRAAIARALANNPAIIVADEPTGNLDSKTAKSIHKLFATLSGSGKTVVVVTHERDESLLHGRTIVLSDGEIVEEIVKEPAI